MKLVNLLAAAKDANATDLLLTPAQVPHIKVKGVLKALGEPLAGDDISQMVYACLSPDDQQDYQSLTQDEVSRAYLIDVDQMGRFRATFYKEKQGISVVLRLHYPKTLTDLGLAKIVGFQELNAGLLLLGGECGSGITTTASALLNHCGRTQGQHIVMLEEVAEQSVVADSGVVERLSYRTCDESLLAMQRLTTASVDILFVDKLQDYRVMHQVLCLAAAGVKVLSTLSISSPLWLLDYFIHQFPQPDRTWIQRFLFEYGIQIVCQRLRMHPVSELAYECLPLTRATEKSYQDSEDDVSRHVIRGLV